MLLVALALNLSEEIIEGYVSDEKESTQLQINSNPLEVLLPASIEVSSCLG